MNDYEGDPAIQSEWLIAPRVTPDDVAANIASEHYFTALQVAIAAESFGVGDDPSLMSLSMVTFCVIVLRNGTTVTGESACVHPEFFNPETGRKVARMNAVSKIWPLMEYELKCRLDECVRPRPL